MGRNLCLNSLLRIYQTLLLQNIGEYRKKHKYYGQVQLGMGILNLNKCYMCLYASYDDSCEIIKIENDYQFTKTMLMKIKNNYFSKMLHVLCEQK
nr:unnamed protein product [Callosobruchus analis]